VLHRTLIASLLAVFTGCSSSASAPSAPSDGGTETAAESGPAPYVPGTNGEFFAAAATPICERVYSCCTTADEKKGALFLFGIDDVPADAAACVAALKPRLADYSEIVDGSLKAGRLKFVPEEAGACLATYESIKTKCEGMLVDGLPNFLVCPKAYQPSVAVGSACIMTTECIDSVCRPTNAERTAAKCQPRGKEGDFCLGAETCEAGLTCSELKSDACVTSGSRVCRKPGNRGSSCCSTDDCAAGLDCYSEGEGKVMCNTELPTTPADPVCTGR
jgi:hypothetical protein